MTADYVSPVDRAREVLARAQADRSSVTRRELSTAIRIAKVLEPVCALDLVRVQAPFLIFRWVAWGDGSTARRKRTDLVLYLRRSIHTSQGGWFVERQLRAALDVWERAVDDARRRGLVQPRPENLPLSLFEDAIRGAMRCARRSPARKTPEAAPLPILTEDERELLARLLQRAS